ncbi:hypothetical protein MUK42_18993, partial [Musa troglodytarum]
MRDDRCFLELRVEGEEAYQTFRRVIETADVVMATYGDPPFLVMFKAILSTG